MPVRRPLTPVEVAFARVERALTDTAGLAPGGPLPPMPPALAGVVWDRPVENAAALNELLAMRRAGVRAVRTAVVEDEALLRAADLLGLALWQDLPLTDLAAPHLVDTLAFAERALAAALARAARHPSARHFGLALGSDTSDPRARAYFERLTALVRERGPGGSRTYYLTRFPESDRCARTVDLVLLDARDRAPADVLAAWRARHREPAGVGAFGAAVRDDQDGGWRTPGTPAAQARALEDGLASALALEGPPEALFVHRWRDGDAAGSSLSAEVQAVGYGLLDAAGRPRPALGVVRGFFTATQRTFAFSAGPPAPEARAAAPLVFAGWAILLVLGVLYAGAPRFSLLAPRYFGRHDLYREAVQRGYDLDWGLNAVLALALALAAGVVGAACFRALGRTDALAAATAGLSPEAQSRVAALLGAPTLLVSVLAAAYGLWLLLNLVGLHGVAGRKRRLRPPQALTLAVWSRWAVFGLLVGAMLLATASPGRATLLAPALLGLWLAAEVVTLGRMAADLAAVARVPSGRAWLLGFALPVVVFGAALLAAATAARAELGFLWHLATRG